MKQASLPILILITILLFSTFSFAQSEIQFQCKFCNFANSDNAVFCGNCGEKLNVNQTDNVDQQVSGLIRDLLEEFRVDSQYVTLGEYEIEMLAREIAKEIIKAQKGELYGNNSVMTLTKSELEEIIRQQNQKEMKNNNQDPNPFVTAVIKSMGVTAGIILSIVLLGALFA